jgi:hypothetical protein
MIASLAFALFVAPQDAPPASPRSARRELPPYICSVRRETPLGTIGAQRSVNNDGVADEPLFNWETWFHQDRAREDQQLHLMAAWKSAPSTYSFGPRYYSDVQIGFYFRGSGPRTFRLRLQDMAAFRERTLFLDSGPIPARDGWTNFYTQWGILTGLIDEAYSARFIVLGDDREVFRSEPIDPATFRNAREMAERLEPELAPLVADYRNRCRNTAAPIEFDVP